MSQPWKGSQAPSTVRILTHSHQRVRLTLWQGGGRPYLFCQPPLQLALLLGAALLLLAEGFLLLSHQALGSQQLCFPLPHGSTQCILLCIQGVQSCAQL